MPANKYRIRASEVAEREGFDSAMALVEDLGIDAGSYPACCTEGCEVEPDGRCEHGCPSILLALGFI